MFRYKASTVWVRIGKTAIKTLYGYKIYKTGKVEKKSGAGFLKFHKSRGGYLIVRLYWNNQRITKSLHWLLAKAFLPNLKGYREVDHRDGNKLNNRLSNLRWCSRSTNIKNAYATGKRSSVGENNGRCLTTKREVLQICRLLHNGLKPKEISNKGFDYRLVRRISSHRNWTHISKNYNFKNKRK